MTGRDLIVYIMSNHLEDQEVFANGKLVGFLTVSEMAKKYNVGESTVRAWCELERVKYVSIGDFIFIADCDYILI